MSNVKSPVLFKRLNSLAIPILLTYMTSFLFTFGDQMIIGRISIEGYASVSMISNILYALTGTLGVMGLCVNIIGSNFLGDNNQKQYENLFNTAYTFSIIIGVLFQVLVFVFGKWFLLNVLKQPSEMIEISLQYLYIASLGIGLNLLLFILSAYYKSVEQPLALVYSSLISNVVNIVVDYTLVFGAFGFPKLGVSGAAIGTVLGLMINLIFYQIHFKRSSQIKLKFMLNYELLRKLFSNYVPLVGQDFLESTVLVLIISGIISRLGTLDSAVYGISNFIMGIFLLPIYAYGNATITLMAKSKGAKDLIAQNKIPLFSIAMLLTVLSILAMPLLFYSDFIISLITNEQLLILETSKIVIVLLLIQLINIPNMIYKYALNGVGDEKWVLYFSLTMTGLTAPMLYYLAIIGHMGLLGIFIGLGLNYLCHTIGFVIRFNLLKKDVLNEDVANIA